MRAPGRSAVVLLLAASALAQSTPTRGPAITGRGPATGGHGPAAASVLTAKVSFTPAQVASVAFDGDTIGQADGTEVLTWVNVGSGGAALNATATTGQAAKYYNAVVNGHAVLRYTLTPSQVATTADIPMTDRVSILVVANFANTTQNYPILAEAGATAGNTELRMNSTAMRPQWLFRGTTGIVSPTALNAAEWHVIEGVYNLTAGAVYVDGSQMITQTNPPIDPGVPRTLTIGHRGPYQFVGDLAYVVAVTTDLADADRQSLEGFLAWRFGLQGLLPAGHPYKASPP